MRISYSASALCMLLATGQASAYTSITNTGRLTAGLLLQDTDYEADLPGTAAFNAETTQVVAAYKAALSPKFALGAGLGVVLDGELSHNVRAKDGGGLRLFTDGQFEFKKWGANELLGTFALVHDRYSFKEDYLGRKIDLDLTLTEMKVGGLFTHRIGQATLHGGLEIYLYSNGDIDFGSGSADVERDDRLNARLGGTFAVDSSIDMRADLFLLNEQTFLFAADFHI